MSESIFPKDKEFRKESDKLSERVKLPKTFNKIWVNKDGILEVVNARTGTVRSYRLANTYSGEDAEPSFDEDFMRNNGFRRLHEMEDI